MADIFKDGILYMDDIHNSDIFSDILEQQENETKKEIEEKEKQLKEAEKETKILEVKDKSKQCFSEIFEKLDKLSDDEFLFNENNRVKCSNGYMLEIIEEDNLKKINLIIPK